MDSLGALNNRDVGEFIAVWSVYTSKERVVGVVVGPPFSNPLSCSGAAWLLVGQYLEIVTASCNKLIIIKRGGCFRTQYIYRYAHRERGRVQNTVSTCY